MSINLTQNLGLADDFKSKIKGARGALLETCLLIAIGVLFWFFMVLPKQTAVFAAQKQLEDLNTEAGKISTTADLLRQRVSELDSDKDKISKLDQALPLSDTLPRLQMLVTQLAEQAAVTVGSLSISGQGGDNVVAGNKTLLANPYGATRSLKTYFIAMTVSGSYDQLMLFLHTLENSGRIMEISSMNISAANSSMLNLQINFSTYNLAP